MLTRKWTIWLGTFLGLAAVGAGLYALLLAQGFTIGANVVSIVATLALGAWALRGLYVWREVTWVRRVNSFVIAAFCFGLVYLIFHAVGAPVFARTTLYLFGTVAGFMLGINIVRLILIPGGPTLGVARAMFEEAIRMKVALIFIVALLALLPLLALLLVGDDRVTYIVQRFLTYALILVSFLLSTMTVILAAYTTSQDLKTKMVYMSLTKPMGRAQYILGKWLGIVLLNAVMLAVSGVAIAGFAVTLADGKAMNRQDQEEVRKEVLTARISQIPKPVDGTFEEMVERTLANRQALDPERYGEVGTPSSALPRQTYFEVESEALSNWFTIEPRESTTYRYTGLELARENAEKAGQEAERILVELGLTAEQARGFVMWQNAEGEEHQPDVNLAEYMTIEQYTEIVTLINSEKVQLVLNPYTKPEPEDGMVELDLVINEHAWPIRPQGSRLPSGRIKVAVDAPHEMSLPAWLIDEDGVLEISIAVPAKRPLGETVREIEQTPVQLNRKDALPEIFYRVGTFEGNLARSVAVLWVRLAFLTMFALLLGSLFSFPVACLAGLLVYVIAAFSGFLTEAVSDFTSVPNADTTWALVTGALGGFFSALGSGEIIIALKLLVGLFAKLVMLLVPSFGEFNPGPPLADGKIVPYSMVYGALLRVGLLWTGIITVLGLLLFQRRELARVTA